MWSEMSLAMKIGNERLISKIGLDDWKSFFEKTNLSPSIYLPLIDEVIESVLREIAILFEGESKKSYIDASEQAFLDLFQDKILRNVALCRNNLVLK